MSDTSPFGRASSSARFSRVRAMLRQTLERPKYGAKLGGIPAVVGVGRERSLMKGGAHVGGRSAG